MALLLTVCVCLSRDPDDSPFAPGAVYEMNKTTAGLSHEVIAIDRPEWRQPLSYQALVNLSDVIIVGRPVKNACHVSQTDYRVTTDYDVEVREKIKGDPGAVIKVSLPGGMAFQSDGRVLDARAKWVRKLKNSSVYVLFLQKVRFDTKVILMPIRGSQGIFEIPTSGSQVVPLGRVTEGPPRPDGMVIGEFLHTVRRFAIQH